MFLLLGSHHFTSEIVRLAILKLTVVVESFEMEGQNTESALVFYINGVKVSQPAD